MVSNIQNTDKLIKSAFNKAKEFTRIILIGKTGAGKSSLANELPGCNLHILKDENNIIKVDVENPLFKIGNVMNSETTVPNIVADDDHKLLYCDAPGFSDARGPYQDNYPDKHRLCRNKDSESEYSSFNNRSGPPPPVRPGMFPGDNMNFNRSGAPPGMFPGGNRNFGQNDGTAPPGMFPGDNMNFNRSGAPPPAPPGMFPGGNMNIKHGGPPS